MSLQDIRKKRGYSQSQLANLSGVAIRSIQLYEQSYRDIEGARIDTLINLCEALDCNLSDIMNTEELIEKLKKRGY